VLVRGEAVEVTDRAELARLRKLPLTPWATPGPRQALADRKRPLRRSLPDYDLVTDPYEALAVDYDWIFDDNGLAGGAAVNRPATARLLQRISRTSAVLDAACGTGINAAALARRGFTVWAADASQAMVAAAAARFRAEQLAVPLVRCTWEELPAATGERFDVVLCIGNSLVHAAGRDAMVQALIGLRRMARPGGHVVIDSRNWEKLHAERRIVQIADRAVTRHGRRCVVLYAWEIPDRLDEEHIAHLVFLFENGDQVEPREYELSFRPFTIAELRERLELAGLREVDTDFDDSGDRYAVVTRAP
jgi:SAM-dependent methyltransferase